MSRTKKYTNILDRVKHASFQKIILNAIGILSALVLIMLCLRYGLIALDRASVFIGDPADGIFQLFNPLRRLDDGQIPGHDFQFFQGIGTLLLHYPIYWLSGNDLSGAELSRWILSPLLFISTALLAFWAITRKWQVTFFFTAITTVLVATYFPILIDSAVSYVGVRSAMPLFVFALLLLWKPKADQKVAGIIKTICIGICLALSFFISTEHGIALILGYTLATLLFYPELTFIKRLKKMIFTGIITSISLLSIFVLVSGKYFLEPITYALQDGTSDQIWYTGAPPSRILSSISDLFVDPILSGIIIGGLILLGIFIYKFRIRPHYRIYIAILALMYGLFSTVGILANYGEGYTSALFRVEIIIILAIVFHYRKLLLNAKQPIKILLYVGSISMLLWLSLVTCHYISVNTASAPTIISQWKHKNGDMFGERLSTQWQSDLAITMGVIRANKGTVWSTYAGLSETAIRQFQPSGYDYIIHVLGAERRQEYLVRFDTLKPEVVITMRHDTFVPWQKWLENENWQFFQRVANNYRLADRTSYSNIWVKNNHSWLTNATNEWTDVSLSKNAIHSIEAPEDGLMEINLKYSADNTFSKLPVIGKLPRYLVIPEKNQKDELAISLSPYMHDHTFPIYVHKGDKILLKPSVTHDYLGSGLYIQSVQYRMLNSEGATTFYNNTQQGE